jgi:ribosomal protein S18 acetylase RimI-like enzyme
VVTELDHVLAFLREAYRRRVAHRIPTSWGELLVTDDLPRVYDLNLALVERWDGDAVSLAAELERASAAAGLRHRKAVVLDQELGERLAPQLPVPSWTWADRNLVMIHRRRYDRPAGLSVEVREVDVEDFVRAREPLRRATGEYDEETARQLGDMARRVGATGTARFFVAVADGLAASSCELLREGVVAQIEDLETFPQYRNRGLARAVVHRAVEEADRDGARITFLLAAEDDWPQQLYRKLGFEAAGVETTFGRPG